MADVQPGGGPRLEPLGWGWVEARPPRADHARLAASLATVAAVLVGFIVLLILVG